MRKKVLLSVPDYSSFFPGLVRAFVYLGFEVKNFDYRKLTWPEKISAFTRGPKTANKYLNTRLINVCLSYRPDIFLTIKGEGLFAETIKKIHKLGAVSINWFPDDLQHFPLAKKLAPSYDLFCHFDPFACRLLKNNGFKNVFNLPLGADILPGDAPPNFYHRKNKIVFIGNYHRKREIFFSAIKDFDFMLWGDKRWQNSLLKKQYLGKCNFKDVAGILQNTQIAVNVHYNSPGLGVNLRVFEATSGGACLITDRQLVVKSFFELDKEMIPFSDKNQLVNQVKWLLRDEATRILVAARAYHRVRNEHTLQQRLSALLKYLTD